MENRKLKILLTGGGTGGSVVPLLAITDELGYEEYKYYWFGTNNGPERRLIHNKSITFKMIVNGKLRRYFSWKNFIDPFFILIGFFQSIILLFLIRPRIIISAGSYVSVPVVWAGWFLGIPSVIHQLDVLPGLANKLMAPFAEKITVTFEDSLKDYGQKAIWCGSPIRNVMKQDISRDTAKEKLNLKIDLPVILIFGGGTGSIALNKIITDSLDVLTKFTQIIHITGVGKKVKNINDKQNYHSFEFLSTQDIIYAYNAADLVISRCGMGALTELSFLSKPSILVPLPNTHQENNAVIFNNNCSAIVLNQTKLTKEEFINEIKELLNNEEKKKQLSININKVFKPGANQKIANIIKKIIEK
jgi:UDP-N-acetylglucosamine--N-acetylmuramyl-(pentapeptide) pyrophosphoryl-undecaprenol N-acetylglucosamine transferase